MENRQGIFTLIALAILAGCSDYGLNELSDTGISDTGISGAPSLTEFVDCTSVVGDRYWYEDHEFGVVMVYDGCTPSTYSAYLLIEHTYERMTQAWTTATYGTDNDDVVTVDAVRYTLDFWYNPVDLEIVVVPFVDNIALGIHEFWIDCTDDDDPVCDIDYLQGVDADDLE